MNNLAYGYALALFQIAKEENELQKYKNSAIRMTELVEENKPIIKIWNDKKIDFQDKELMIKKVFKKFSENLVVFLIILSRKRKVELFVETLNCFINQVNKELNIHEGIIYSVDPLSANEIEKIKQRVSQMLKIKVKLNNLIDKNLVSGIKIVVEDKIIEDSLFTRIEAMKKSLLTKHKGDN